MLCICLWIIWNDWANYFFWITSWPILSDPKMLYDFFNLYTSGKWWLSLTKPYVNLQTPLVYSLAYPPSSLPFFGLFALFDFGLAAQLWTATFLSLFIVALLALGFSLKGSRRHSFVALAILLFLTSYPLRAEMHLGQVNVLIESLTILSLVLQRLKHYFGSAILLSIGTLMKGPPVLFLIYFVFFCRDFRYFIRFLLSTLAIIGISLFVVPIQFYWYWAVNVVPTLSVASSSALGQNQSVAGWATLAGFSNLTPAMFLVALCSFAVFAFYVTPKKLVRRFGMVPLRADAMFLMNTLVMLLFGSRSWPQTYVWIILPSALFLSGLLMEEVKAAYVFVVGLAAFLMNYNPNSLFMYYVYIARTLPPTIMGNLMMIMSLILFLVRPHAIFHRTKNHWR